MDIINEINNMFLTSNKINRSKIINSLPVILIFNQDQLSLIQYGNITNTIKLELKNYHMIKSICHYISGHNLKLIDNNELDNKVVEYITINRTLFELDSIRYWCGLVNMIKTKTINYDILRVAMKHTATLFQEELHNKVQNYKQSINNEDEWDNVMIIVTGPPSPRPGHSAMQYFCRLTGKQCDLYSPSCDESCKKQNRKLYYLENIYDLDKILDGAGQLLLERKEYDKIIDMKMDILAYDSKEYLMKVCNK